MNFFFKTICILCVLIAFNIQKVEAEENTKFLKVDWSFKGLFGKFDRASLQRGYQVYVEVCASCHSMKHLSYRNLAEEGGPEFSEDQAKAIASSFELTDGPNSDGEMFTDQQNFQINLLNHIKIVKKLKHQMVELIHRICLY